MLIIMLQFFDRLNEGGPFFTYPLFLILIIMLILLAQGFLKKRKVKKIISLVNSMSLFALVWSFLGHIVGIIVALDTIEVVGDISSSVLVRGLSLTLLTLVFGSSIFLIGRLGTIVLIWMQKE